MPDTVAPDFLARRFSGRIVAKRRTGFARDDFVNFNHAPAPRAQEWPAYSIRPPFMGYHAGRHREHLMEDER